MTSGSPFRLIMEFSIPVFLSALLYQLYNTVDTVIVGRCLGVNSLAAVGSTGSLNYMVCGFCMGICNGLAIPVAQKFGAGDEKALKKIVVNSVWLSAIASVVITVFVCFFCWNILQWVRTPANVIQEAYEYIFIIFLGIPLIFLCNVSGGIIRSLGDSRTPLYFSVLSSVLNVGLDLLFIQVFHMGVRGPALSTVISQLFSGTMCLYHIRKNYENLQISREEWKPDGKSIRMLCGIGLPMGLQNSITAVGSVIIQAAVNTLGSVSVAAVTAAGRINQLLCTPVDALASTISTYAGQNMGAGKPERIRQGMRNAMGVGALYVVAAYLWLYFGGRALVMLFVEAAQEDIIDRAYQFQLVNGRFFFLLLTVNVVRITIQGMGFTGLAMLAGVCEMAARTVTAFLLVPLWGFRAVCYANPIAWLAASLFLVWAYRHCIRRIQPTAQFLWKRKRTVELPKGAGRVGMED